MKQAKFKVSLRVLLSLCTAILLLCSMIPVATSAGTEAGYVTATNPRTVFAVKAADTSKITNVAVEGSATTLTPTMPAAAYLTGTGYPTAKQLVRVNTSSNYPSVASGQSVMFYFKAGSTDNSLLFGCGGSTPMYLSGTYAYYTRTAADSDWQSATSNSDGYMPISANFEGWILLPYSSWAEGSKPPSLQWFGIRFGVAAAEYTFFIGTMMLVNTETPTFDSVSFDGGTSTAYLFEGMDSEEPEEPTVETIDNYTAAMSAELNVRNADIGTEASHEVTAGEIIPRPTADTPNILGQFSKFTVGKSAAFFLLSQGITFTNADQAMMFYVKSESDAETRVKPYFSGGDYLITAGEKYYRLASGGSWVEDVADSSRYITLPANFEGWVRIPNASFTTSAVGVTTNATRFYLNFHSDSIGQSYYFGALCVVENANSTKFSVNGSAVVDMFPTKTITTPEGVSTNVNTFYGCEKKVLVTLTGKTIGDFNGNKLYYQYTPAGATASVKMALERYGVASHDYTDNVTEFYVPFLNGTDGAIVEGDVAEDVTVVGTSAWYSVDENDAVSYTYDNNGEEYFKIRFTGRAARETEFGTLKYMTVQVKVRGTDTWYDYPIKSTLADVCTDYVDFVKVLAGPVATKAAAEYDVRVTCTYVAADGVTTHDLTSASFESPTFNQLRGLQ